MTDMLKVLHQAERALPELIRDRAGWNGIYADTERPHLKRLWRQWGEYRVNLHVFEGMGASQEAFAHPHPWAFAVRVHEGRYKMDVGPGVARMDTQVVLGPGCEYAIGDGDVWHAIRPLELVSRTVMVSGPPRWQRNRVRANKVVRGLTSAETAEMLAWFGERYAQAPAYDLHLP